jgi:nitrite reductase/ring-hydroxylating ferredoxin subunit
MSDAVPIGSAELLESTPVVVTVEGSRYILSTDVDDEPVLFSAVCPHQHGRVGVRDGGTLRCPNHRWEFDAATGECLRGGDEPLESVPVYVENGQIYAVPE